MSVIRWSIPTLFILALIYGQSVNVYGATLCSPSCLLVANTSDIVTVDYNTAAVSSVVSGLTRAVAVDVHFNLGYIFWSDVTEKNIKRFRIDVASTTTIVTGIGVCDGLAVDWRASQLYWTDTTYYTISVSDLDGKNQALLISSGLEEPRGIALDLDDGLMFWTDWGINAKIEKASLNGGQRVTIVTTYLYYPNGIELDRGNKRIFWVDAGYDTVESVDYNGNNQKLLNHLSGLHPFGLTLIPPFLFFTDWLTAEDIHQLDATTGKIIRKYSVNGGQPMGIVAYDASRQPAASNPCTVNNGGCSHFCVVKSSGYECVCPTGLTVKQDGKTCEEKVKKFLLFADADDKSTQYVSLDTNYFTSQTLFYHLGTQRPIALDYDPVEDRVYWSDIAQGRIISAFFNATSVKNLFRCNVETPDGLAIDYVGRNIYWTDTGTNRIEVGLLDGTGRKLLIKDGLDEPRAIVLDERNGMMYWTDWGANPKIEQAEMDGSARQTIVTGNLVWPNGLTIDPATNRLFWVDAWVDKIEVSDLNGGNRQLIMSSAANIHPYGLAVYQDMLYWTDWNTKSISRLNVSSGNQAIIVNGLQKPMDIHVFDPALIFSGFHNCSHNNGLCSDFCLLKPGGYQCACPTGIALKSDGKTCDHDTGEIYKVPLEVPETPCYPLGITANISRPVAVDYDPVEGKIYWTDVTLELLARAFPNGSSVEVIAYGNVTTPGGLAVDYVGRNIYWTDEGASRIEVARLDGSSRTSLITSSVVEPRAILLDIGERKMYWGSRGLSPKIEQANMDGSARTTLVSSGLLWVNALTLDYLNRQLYWCDAYLDKIERVDLQGSNRVLILDLSLDSLHPFGLALFGDALYWSDWNSQNVHKYNMTTSLTEVVVQGMETPMELHVYDQSKDFTG
ncbi:low-density lipoprotein receptor-related protein 4-like isoform X3 [Orbicella faveolata]|uniref:low-density lipoprotein receptor-related protein 4-like isoform X3 n=1 Tax=Orbicella faveolata TaxID=48498 RepID=UPI0009E24918|nr:low-density lipoprotein receptor-related protein 4-like isoform X3 [Orbicella faveolata]